MPVDDADEAGLVDQARAGDRGAFARLADRYWGRVVRWLAGLSGDAHAAEDLAQDVFLRAWTALGSFRPGTNFRAWLFRIARNGFLDSRRSPRGRAVLPLPAAVAAPQPGPVGVALAEECAERVAGAVARLQEPYRAVVLLRSQEGLSFAEIARVLDVTEETARWRLFKARQLLVKDLGDYLDRADA